MQICLCLPLMYFSFFLFCLTTFVDQNICGHYTFCQHASSFCVFFPPSPHVTALSSVLELLTVFISHLPVWSLALNTLHCFYPLMATSVFFFVINIPVSSHPLFCVLSTTPSAHLSTTMSTAKKNQIIHRYTCRHTNRRSANDQGILELHW